MVLPPKFVSAEVRKAENSGEAEFWKVALTTDERLWTTAKRFLLFHKLLSANQTGVRLSETDWLSIHIQSGIVSLLNTINIAVYSFSLLLTVYNKDLLKSIGCVSTFIFYQNNSSNGYRQVQWWNLFQPVFRSIFQPKIEHQKT